MQNKYKPEMGKEEVIVVGGESGLSDILLSPFLIFVPSQKTHQVGHYGTEKERPIRFATLSGIQLLPDNPLCACICAGYAVCHYRMESI